ncbi:hypothetical protein MRB53_016285 [Persea americana]|uniref:Uncharacterized protein n=1 Tax=Persea americana TaxID=3435 RepID=A0ACC2M2P6_PERAE|nr:hypothetical protein MRB53_016285 [Persea americana]
MPKMVSLLELPETLEPELSRRTTLKAKDNDDDRLSVAQAVLISLNPDELADAVATTAQQETDDEARLDDNA